MLTVELESQQYDLISRMPLASHSRFSRLIEAAETSGTHQVHRAGLAMLLHLHRHDHGALAVFFRGTCRSIGL